MITELSVEQKELIVNNRELFRYLLGLNTSVSFTPRSWLYENRSPEAVLSDWLERLRTLGTGSSDEKEVFAFDISQLEKWGPQGGHAPMRQLYPELIEPTFAKHSPASAFGSALWEYSIDLVAKKLKARGVNAIRPVTYSHVVDNMRARGTLESNSGWPSFKRRNLPEVKKLALDDAVSGLWENYPAIALFRTYRGKTRPVWMFPESTNIVEGSFTQPLLKSFLATKYNTFVPWLGFDAVRKVISSSYEQGLFVYATDFSATDEHFRFQTSEQVLRLFQRGVIHKSHMVMLATTVHNMHTIPLVISPNKQVVGEHGLASGSNWTNMLETVFDVIFGKYVERQVDNEWQLLYAIGDDMCWISPHEGSHAVFPEFMESMGNQVGQKLNAEKVSAYPNKVKTLQRLFIRGYRRPDGLLRGVYSTIRALNSSIYPERFHKPKDWSSDMFCSRQFMILENCVDHPLFEEFVRFVVAGQKDLIPFAKKSRADLRRILQETRLLPGLNPTYNQEKRDMELSEFESIRIARNL